jgi:hypothetical protein
VLQAVGIFRTEQWLHTEQVWLPGQLYLYIAVPLNGIALKTWVEDDNRYAIFAREIENIWRSEEVLLKPVAVISHRSTLLQFQELGLEKMFPAIQNFFDWMQAGFVV